ncbi:uncharacterized protein LOC110293714 [Mus caroli]|uniref:Uncharacterized protein LOC110293714 n=1 Tax=Mus caroli TaxID=10089 RepID=A0A6P7QVC7_MUSCR|nr:uncharacterized protein LOC110293714 [Mus caroli]
MAPLATAGLRAPGLGQWSRSAPPYLGVKTQAGSQTFFCNSWTISLLSFGDLLEAQTQIIIIQVLLCTPDTDPACLNSANTPAPTKGGKGNCGTALPQWNAKSISGKRYLLQFTSPQEQAIKIMENSITLLP